MAIDQIEAERRLRSDYAFYAEKCLKIISQRNQIVPLVLNDSQREVIRVLREQDEAGRPMRALILKARKLGMSTAIEGFITHRYSTRPNHKAVVVAHDLKTSKELFAMSELMYQMLPERRLGDLVLKPGVVASRMGQEIRLGEESRTERRAGRIGINSSLLVDTAGEVKAGRGFTYHLMHLSELAHYPDEQKLTALLNSVPDEPGTLIVGETTANGYNFFRRRWKQAEAGESDYAAIFFPWFVDPRYALPFASALERDSFEAKVGSGEYGEGEFEVLPLIEAYWSERPERPDPLAQLHWRRRTIINRFGGDLRMWSQEFPATADEAFLATGRQVFSISLISRVIERTEKLVADQGILRGEDFEERNVRGHTMRVPKRAIWTPREELDISPIGQPFWQRWEAPNHGNHKDFPGFDRQSEMIPPGQYVVSCDPASGEETDAGDLAWHAIEVIDHSSRKQVAQWRSRLDPDQVTLELYLAGRYYNDAWIAVEKTGGYGNSIINALWRVYRYPKIYARKAADVRTEHSVDRLGWDTTPVTKPWLIDHTKELLRTGTDGIRSPLLADEFTTFVRDEMGRTGPEADSFADLLMAYMIGQLVANQVPLRSFQPARKAPTRQVLSRAGGY